jgi:pyruvate/2-oxoglutarate dehydrogenase complex dihydrolipoamide dehydrogenase (E3) component
MGEFQKKNSLYLQKSFYLRKENRMRETKDLANIQFTTNAETEVDIIVLGVGTCGEDLSLRLLDAGLEVVGIEAALVGGECAYWACLPSKAMIRAANLVQETRRAGEIAGKIEITPDWSQVAERVRDEVTGGWDDSTAVERYKSRGGRLIKGYGKLAGSRTVIVGDQRFTARRGIIIATGSKPAIPPIQGIDEVDYWTTRDVIQLEKLPKSLIVLGGGAVGCELCQVLARFGVEVTIVEAADRILPAEEPEVGEVVETAFSSEGIQVHTGAAVNRVTPKEGSILVSLNNGMQLQSERLLVATGRKVDLSGLGLESAGIDENKRFIRVDERMRAADGIWAMGDVTGKAMFTHVALYQSAIIAAEILGEEHPPARYHAVPRATFTDPEVGAVGMTEAEAIEAGLDVVAVVKQLPATFRGWLHAAKSGTIKLVVDRNTGVLVGATVAGPNAGELLGLLTLAVHGHIPLSELRSMIYAFPTFYGGIGEAVGAYARGLVTVLDPGYQGNKVLDAVEVAD